MAFKHKKKIDEILTMGFMEYAKFLKKEINRAVKSGELDAVVCSHHTFADGKESALLLFGGFTGELAKFFKKNKTAPGFGKGKCYFEQTEGGVTMHVALNTGKGKPDKVKKGGKKLWSKLGVKTEFYKGELPQLSKDLDKVNIGEEALKEEVDADNDQQNIKLLIKNYQQAKAMLHQEVLPLIKDKNTADTAYSNQHFDIAKAAFKAAASLTDKFGELPDKKLQKFQKTQETVNKDYPQLKRIAAKIKKALMENNVVDVELKDNLSDEEQAESVKMSMQALKKELEEKKELIQAKIKKLNPELKKLLNLK